MLHSVVMTSIFPMINANIIFFFRRLFLELIQILQYCTGLTMSTLRPGTKSFNRKMNSSGHRSAGTFPNKPSRWGNHASKSTERTDTWFSPRTDLLVITHRPLFLTKITVKNYFVGGTGYKFSAINLDRKVKRSVLDLTIWRQSVAMVWPSEPFSR